MNFTKRIPGWLIGAFVWCIFMGVTAISIGVGALFPALNYVAKPLACPNGDLTFQQTVSNPLPGTTYTQTGWYCTDQHTEAKSLIDPITMGLYAGPFYGLLLFALICFFWYMNSRWASVPIIGKNINKIGAGLVVVFILLVTAFNLAPIFRNSAPSAEPATLSPEIQSNPGSVATLQEPYVPSTLRAPVGPPTVESIEHAKAVHAVNGPSLDALASEQYGPSDFSQPGTRTFTVHLSAPITVQWEYGWCAATSQILSVDLKSIEPEFVLDGQIVPLSFLATDDGPGNGGEQCHSWYAVLSRWPAGVHHLTTTATFTTMINDGKSEYAAGDYVMEYTVTYLH